MTPVQNLKFPAPADATPPQQAKPQKGSKGYTNIDTELDEPVLQALPAALWPAAYFLMKFRHMRPVKTPEVQLFTGKGASQAKADLARLEKLGHAVGAQGEWAWANSKAAKGLAGQQSRKTGRKTDQETGRKTGFLAFKNTVQNGKKWMPNEVELTRTNLKENNNIFYVTGFVRAPQLPPTAVAVEIPFQKNEPEVKILELPTPDGAASGEASGDKPSPSQEKNVSDNGETSNVTDSETVPPAPATYGKAKAVLSAAGAWDVWNAWTRAHRPPRAAQDAQIIQCAVWVGAGLKPELAQHAAEITAAGSYAHPWPALVARMGKASAARVAAQRTTEDARAVFGEGACQPGQRRRDPQTGQIWTVEEVAYGNVIFEEGHAPQDRKDVAVASWEVLA